MALNQTFVLFILYSKLQILSQRSREIISKHYISGQFSLDNGLYKEAALNFGTVLEGVLSKDLSSKSLNDLIRDYSGSADITLMNEIRKFRNKVHPKLIGTSQDITRYEGIKARNNLEIILKTL